MSAVNAAALLAAAGGDYTISRSVRLRSSATAYFNRTPASAGNQTTWTWSGWVKRGALGAEQVLFSAGLVSPNRRCELYFTSGDALSLYTNSGTGSTDGDTAKQITTSQVFRDPSAWYHITAVVDTTDATSTNRLKLYVNGVQVTAFASSAYPSQNHVTAANSTNVHYHGRWVGPTLYYFDGYLTEVNFIDGQALTPSSFGETDAVTGVWKPKRYAGTYGTNGFYLNFSDNSAATAAAIGKDSSGNGNNWTPNNISVTAGVTYDSMLDTPTPYADGGNGRGNYAVLNPLAVPSNLTASVVNGIINGNLTMSGTAMSANSGCVLSSIGMTSGKWYAEMTVTTVGFESSCGIGQTALYNSSVGVSADSWGYYYTGLKQNNGTSPAYGASYTSGDVIGIAFDADAGELTFYKNGTTQGVAFTGLTSGPYYFMVEGRKAGSVNLVSMNFGQRPFAYTPPTGFKALNTQNLPDATIKKGNAYFDVTLWTGDGASSRTIGSLAFQPDFIWTKRRSGGTANSNHWLFDSVRGAGSNSLLTLESNSTSAEFDTKGGSGNATAITASGFTITGGTSNNNNLNESGSTFAAWQWKESASAGFDIVTATMNASGSTTINHSLGVTPNFVITKNRSGTIGWNVYSSVLGVNQYLGLNTTAAATTSAGFWGAPSSTQFTFSSAFANTGTYVAYLFAEVAGFSKFGSYTGNGSADGPFVYCGFRPRFVLLKRSDAVANWHIWDSARNTFNVAGEELYPNLSNAGYTDVYLDFTSNGFKIRNGTTGEVNANGSTYIYAAFAENPFKNSLAR